MIGLHLFFQLSDETAHRIKIPPTLTPDRKSTALHGHRPEPKSVHPNLTHHDREIFYLLFGLIQQRDGNRHRNPCATE